MDHSPEKPSDRLTDIFINYRRKDTAGYAGRLQQDLNKRFPGRIFMDIHNIEAGRDFTEVIGQAMGRCAVLIVMIGDQWLNITDPITGKRRLDDPNDLVAIEIAEALKRNTRVIPVLVEGAQMPQQTDLPAALAGLVRRNAFELSDTRWPYDVERLGNQLEKICGRSPQGVAVVARAFASTAGEFATGKWGLRRISKLAIILTVAAAAILIAVKVMNPAVPTVVETRVTTSPTPTPTPTPTPNPSPNGDSASLESVLTRCQALVTAVDNSEAIFDFPFDTRGSNWKWYREDSPPEKVEYNWEVKIQNKTNKATYWIKVYLQKGHNQPGNGDLQTVIKEAEKVVITGQLDGKNPSALQDWPDGGTVDIRPKVYDTGLRLIISGKGVAHIFKGRPEDARLRTTNLQLNIQANDCTRDVIYPR